MGQRLCGTPREFWEVINFKKVCPNCEAIKTVDKKCIGIGHKIGRQGSEGCGKRFQPGCRSLHLCEPCYQYNGLHSLPLEYEVVV